MPLTGLAPSRRQSPIYRASPVKALSHARRKNRATVDRPEEPQPPPRHPCARRHSRRTARTAGTTTRNHQTRQKTTKATTSRNQNKAPRTGPNKTGKTRETEHRHGPIRHRSALGVAHAPRKRFLETTSQPPRTTQSPSASTGTRSPPLSIQPGSIMPRE